MEQKSIGWEKNMEWNISKLWSFFQNITYIGQSQDTLHNRVQGHWLMRFFQPHTKPDW